MNKHINLTLFLSTLIVSAVTAGGWISQQLHSDMQALNKQLTALAQSTQATPATAFTQQTVHPTISATDDGTEE